MAKKNALGTGIDELMRQNTYDDADVITPVPIERIIPDINQHRKTFSDDTLTELSESIKAHGVISPLIVKAVDGGNYMIIAGERRFRASKLAGLTELPVIIKSVSEQDAAEIALIENLQREDLNPIDEAGGFQKLIENFGITQEEAAKRVGKSRTAVTNALRLLSLPDAAKNMLRDGIISAGHARALLALKDEDKISSLLNRIIENSMSVRETENAVKALLAAEGIKEGRITVKPVPKKPDEIYLSHLKFTEQKASEFLGRKVKIIPGNEGAGKLVLDFFDSDDLEELFGSLGVEELSE
ncbi:MAG: ParB/RepB/Spo0J family partition protein [Oscillospiraceae bacterium]|nr:ParB/RepB/Spo0J family partition protein [Oscillospiraceae bacterium]